MKRRWRRPPRKGTAASLPHSQAILWTTIAPAFEELGVAIALRAENEWFSIHVASNVIHFEFEHGVEQRRYHHNHEAFERVRTTQKPVLKEHAGFFDLYVPIVNDRGVWGILVTGPFSRTRPSRDEMASRWRWLTGSEPNLADPAFAEYLSATLATLTLEGPLLETFQGLVRCFAALLSGKGDVRRIAAEAAGLRSELAAATVTEEMARDARSMLNERALRGWTTIARADRLKWLGLKEIPRHVVVGFVRPQSQPADPLDDLLKRDAFQRACSDFARKSGRLLSARVGGHGVMLLVDDPGPVARRRGKISDLVQRLGTIAARFGFKLHLGVAQTEDAPTLGGRYQAALWAAETALARRVASLPAERQRRRPDRPLHELRRGLGTFRAEELSLLSARFQRYTEAVEARYPERLDAVRAHLDAGLERLLDRLTETTALDRKAVDELLDTVERDGETATSVESLCSIYRRIVADRDLATQGAARARKGQGLARVIGFIREHLGEPLTLKQVSKASGFAPGYLSKLLKREEGLSFEGYVRRVRLERAKGMLAGTSLNVEQVGKLCGFHTRNYFHRVFKESESLTPTEYRERHLGPTHDTDASPKSRKV